MARIINGLFDVEVDEFDGSTCPRCEGNGGYIKDAKEGLIVCENKDCGGTGLVDRKVKSKVRFKVKPFSYAQKLKLVEYQSFQMGKLAIDSLRRSGESIRLAVKGVEGLFTDEEGKVPYKLKFVADDPEQGLTEECLSDILNTKLTAGLMAGCSALLAGVGDQVTDSKGRAIPGVRFVFPKAGTESPNP